MYVGLTVATSRVGSISFFNLWVESAWVHKLVGRVGSVKSEPSPTLIYTHDVTNML